MQTSKEILYARIDISNMIFVEKLSKKHNIAKGLVIDEMLKALRLKREPSFEKVKVVSPNEKKKLSEQRHAKRIKLLEQKKRESRKSQKQGVRNS